jgi:membrane fusion protein, multidrug efflux system
MCDKKACNRLITRASNHELHNSTVVALLLLIVVMLAGCSKKQEKPRSKPTVPVVVALAGIKTIPLQLRAIGNVEAYNSVAVKAQVSGIVAQVHFREGQDVKKGDLLFTIDPRPLETAFRQAEAILARDLAQTRNALEQATRYAALLKDGIVTQEQYDQLRTAAEAYSATVAADRAAVENARIQLGYCTIRSPLTGRTGNLALHAGNVVRANEEPALVTINQINPVYVTFSVPETELSEIRRHLAAGELKVEALLPGDGQGAESGVISFVDNLVDTATGTIRLKGTFANKKRRLWPGQFVNVALTLTTLPNATVVPSQAVQTGQQGQFVFVVKADATAEQRPVAAGITHEGFTVIALGLQPGETVVTDGQMRLSPGAPVAVKQGPGSGPSPAEKLRPAGGTTAVKPAAAAQGKQP